jgi:hypothetical protein
VLDLKIEHSLHGQRSGIAQHRTGAERPRFEFHAALEPEHRLLI